MKDKVKNSFILISIRIITIDSRFRTTEYLLECNTWSSLFGKTIYEWM